MVNMRVRELFKAVLSSELIKNIDINHDNVCGWDSLKHMELIFMLEDEFNIKFTKDEMKLIETMEDAIKLVSEKTNAA